MTPAQFVKLIVVFLLFLFIAVLGLGSEKAGYWAIKSRTH